MIHFSQRNERETDVVAQFEAREIGGGLLILV